MALNIFPQSPFGTDEVLRHTLAAKVGHYDIKGYIHVFEIQHVDMEVHVGI